MRSRALQPRSLFRIATSPSTPAAGSVLVASSAATSTSIATATGSSRQSSHVPPSRSLSRTRSRTRANSSSSSSSSSAASAAAHTANSSVRRSSGGGATPTSARASSSQAFPPPTTYRLSHPVIPVRPPPHSQVSVGLQSFFCQGRPLLEHHNILEGGRGSGLSGSGAGAGSGNHPAMVGVAMMIPSDLDIDGGATSSSSRELEEQSGSSSASAGEGTLLRNQRLPEGVEAQIKAKAEALLERMTTLRDELAKASPEERQKMLASAGKAAKDILPADFKQIHQSLSSLSPGLMTFRLHLPALQSIPTLAFNKMLDSITSAPSSSGGKSSASSPLSLYTEITTLQQFESDRQMSIKQALERGEDPELASALGPESDLVVLGEPEGPRKEWGRGVTSYLAKVGRPFSPPAAPVKGEEAARVKGLDDLMSYHVSTTEGEMDAEGEFVEMHEGAQGASMADLLAEHLGESSTHSHSHSNFRTSTSTTSSTSTSGSGDPEDLNLWLGHAIVQERLKAQLPWDRLVAQMDRASVRPQGEEGIQQAEAPVQAVDVSNLRITLPTTAPEKTQGRNVRRSPKIFTRTQATSTGEGEAVQAAAEAASDTVVSMDSVRRKRKKKMNKMKYKKLRKRQRSERQRLKK